MVIFTFWRTICTFACLSASTLTVKLLAVPVSIYVPSSVMVSVLLSDACIVFAAEVSGVCFKSRLLKRSVVSSLPFAFGLNSAVSDEAVSDSADEAVPSSVLEAVSVLSALSALSVLSTLTAED